MATAESHKDEQSKGWHNRNLDLGPLCGMRDWFLGDCDRCGKHTRVVEFVASREWRENGEEAGTRCVMCIWAMRKVFAWREWRPETSKLYIGDRPAILDARGVPIRPGYVLEPARGKVSLPSRAI